MTIPPSQICFGLSDELDKQSFSCFLQLAGRKEFAEILASRLASDEIDSFVNSFTEILRKHLTENEYHSLFLQDSSHHSTTEENEHGI